MSRITTREQRKHTATLRAKIRPQATNNHQKTPQTPTTRPHTHTDTTTRPKHVPDKNPRPVQDASANTFRGLALRVEGVPPWVYFSPGWRCVGCFHWCWACWASCCVLWLWHPLQSVCRLLGLLVPPVLRFLMWSIWRVFAVGSCHPQCWHVWWSLVRVACRCFLVTWRFLGVVVQVIVLVRGFLVFGAVVGFMTGAPVVAGVIIVGL